MRGGDDFLLVMVGWGGAEGGTRVRKRRRESGRRGIFQLPLTLTSLKMLLDLIYRQIVDGENRRIKLEGPVDLVELDDGSVWVVDVVYFEGAELQVDEPPFFASMPEACSNALTLLKNVVSQCFLSFPASMRTSSFAPLMVSIFASRSSWISLLALNTSPYSCAPST